MIRGGLAGRGSRGGRGAIDGEAAAPGRDWWRLLYPKDAGGTFVASSTRVRFAGVTNGSPGDATSGLGVASNYAGVGAGADRMFAIPEWFPVAGRIKRICTFAQPATLSVSGRMQLHIYSSGVCETAGAFQGWPYPAQLRASGTLFQPALEGAAVLPSPYNVYDSLIDLAVDAQTLLWFVLRCNTNYFSGTKWGLARGLMPGWIGFTVGGATQSVDAATLGCGFFHSHTWADGAAATFPQTSPSVIPCGTTTTTTDIPRSVSGSLRTSGERMGTPAANRSARTNAGARVDRQPGDHCRVPGVRRLVRARPARGGRR